MNVDLARSNPVDFSRGILAKTHPACRNAAIHRQRQTDESRLPVQFRLTGAERPGHFACDFSRDNTVRTDFDERIR